MPGSRLGPCIAWTRVLHSTVTPLMTPVRKEKKFANEAKSLSTRHHVQKMWLKSRRRHHHCFQIQWHHLFRILRSVHYAKIRRKHAQGTNSQKDGDDPRVIVAMDKQSRNVLPKLVIDEPCLDDCIHLPSNRMTFHGINQYCRTT
jgi:hypothetical protein